MGIPLYLAMTAAELGAISDLPEKMAYMACHFSPYGTGITNIPTNISADSVLILNDRTPIRGHDPDLIKLQIGMVINTFQCKALVLDFQRKDSPEAFKIVSALRELACPVIATTAFALDGPVLLPPVPLTMPISEYLAPWQGRDIWLEAALDGICITVTENGSICAPLPSFETPDCPHYDKELICHYRVDLHPGRAVFTLRRTQEDLTTLLAEAEKYGVASAVGLWQELRDGIQIQY